MANRSHRWGDLRDDVPRDVRAGCSCCTRDPPEMSYTVVLFNAIIDVSIGIQQNVIKSTHGSCMMADGLNVDVDNSRRRRKSYASSSPTKFVRIINDVSFYLILPPPSSPYLKIKIESHPASSSIISYSITVLLLFLFLLLIHVVVPWVCVMSSSSSSSSCSSFNSLCA